MNEKQAKYYKKMAAQFTPKSKKPADVGKLMWFNEGFRVARNQKRIAVSQRKKALARNPVKMRPQTAA